MEIILMRHGKPLLTHFGLVSPAEMKMWIEHYNYSLVDAKVVPELSIQLAVFATSIVSSTAPRALSSLYALGLTPVVTDSIFSEAELPYAPWQFPRLSPTFLAVCFRILWFWGYSRNSEPFNTAKSRAKIAANKLVVLAEEGSVLLMGHGIMNKLIAKELVALGWIGPSKQNNQYWAANVYITNPTQPSSTNPNSAS